LSGHGRLRLIATIEERCCDRRRLVPARTSGGVELRRVWSSVRISWYLTNLLHRFPGASDFDQRAQECEPEYLKSSYHAQAALAEQYAGLPFEDPA
jgi:hypothetical protein